MAVVFHSAGIKLAQLPTRQYPQQKWVFWCMEQPPLVKVLKHVIDSMFNWTMMYRYDSDVIMRYGSYTRKKKPITLEFEGARHRKKRTAVWVISRCESFSRRECFVVELQKYIDVAIYGACGRYKCPWRHSGACYRMFKRDYYFYLSLENSHCSWWLPWGMPQHHNQEGLHHENVDL